MDITIRQATEADFEAYYAHKSEKEDIYWNGFAGAPDKEGLRKAFLSRINHSGNKEIKIIEVCGKYAGYIQYTYGENEIEVGIGVSEFFTGKGIGREAIYVASHIEDRKKVFARIRDDNMRSQKCFMNAGYVRTDCYTEEVFYPLKGNIKLRRYDFAEE